MAKVLTELPKVGERVRVLMDAFTDESHIGEIYEVIELDGSMINVNAEWNDGTTMNYSLGEYEIVVDDDESQPDVHALIANLGRRLIEVEEKLEQTELDATLTRFEEAVAEFAAEDTPNMVDSPPHYTQGEIEVIDYIDQVADGYDGRQAAYAANVIKYVSRAPYKNQAQDIRKAIWYAERLANAMEAEAGE